VRRLQVVDTTDTPEQRARSLLVNADGSPTFAGLCVAVAHLKEHIQALEMAVSSIQEYLALKAQIEAQNQGPVGPIWRQ
jgi:hypothetical protein